MHIKNPSAKWPSISSPFTGTLKKKNYWLNSFFFLTNSHLCSTRLQNRNLYWIFLDDVGSDQSGGILSPFMGTACFLWFSKLTQNCFPFDIWWVTPQFGYGDIQYMLMWFHEFKQYYIRSENVTNGGMGLYQIRKIAGCACTENTGDGFPATNFKGNHQLAIPACITARTSRTCRDVCRIANLRWGKTFPAFPALVQAANLGIW